ncbi:HAD family phosphatase [Dyella sp. C9]|uniref:HAD family hydrolase n=1 Tax=Dyella sp. C9 TaxID=2202154 RepID=UPI000DF0169C|nr:HAD family phosphatase [Dyella sp. C9]
MSTALHCVLFDLDDVLADYDRSVRVRTLAEALGRSPQAVQAAIYESGIEDAGDSGALDAGAYLAALGAWLECSISEEAWTAARRAATRIRPEVLALAERLGRHLTVALLTNNGVLMARQLPYIAPPLFPLFEGRAFASAQFGARKPDARVYLDCLDALGMAPATTLFVDDNIANVEGARRAGLHAHHFVDLAGLHAALRPFGLP